MVDDYMILDGRSMRLTGDGCLEVHMCQDRDLWSGWGGRLRYSPWDDGLSVLRWDGTTWQQEATDPRIPLVTQSRKVACDSPLGRFVGAIPSYVREAVRPFDCHQTAMLRLAAGSPAGMDLLYGNPVLLWLIAEAAASPRITAGEIRDLMRWQQRRTLRHLTGNGSEAAVRFLRKLEVRDGDYLDLRLVKSAMAQEAVVRQFFRCATVPVHALCFVRQFPEIAQTRLIEEIVHDPTYTRATATLHATQWRRNWLEVHALARRLGIGGVEHALGRCATARQLERLVERWRARDARLNGTRPNTDFPPPPVPGTALIQPLCDEEALHEEGRAMEHCVGTLGVNVRAGQAYFYRVLAPERATLEISVDFGAPRISRLLLKANQVPGPATRAAVDAWLRQHGHAPARNDPADRSVVRVDGRWSYGGGRWR